MSISASLINLTMFSVGERTRVPSGEPGQSRIGSEWQIANEESVAHADGHVIRCVSGCVVELESITGLQTENLPIYMLPQTRRERISCGHNRRSCPEIGNRLNRGGAGPKQCEVEIRITNVWVGIELGDGQYRIASAQNLDRAGMGYSPDDTAMRPIRPV
jgi:hypothetical protein